MYRMFRNGVCSNACTFLRTIKRIWFSNMTFCYDISDLSNRVLTTLFHIGNVRTVSSIVHSARKALLKDFVPKYMGAGHVSRDDIIVSVSY